MPSEMGRTAVCFVDGCNAARAALDEAIRSKRSQDKLIVVHFVNSEAAGSVAMPVAPVFFDYSAEIGSQIQSAHSADEVSGMKRRVYEQAKETTLQYKRVLEEQGVTNVELLLMPCVRPQARAVEFVSDVGAEIVYVGTHNFGVIARAILGSFSQHILHNTHGCVVIAQDQTAKERMPVVEMELDQPVKVRGDEELLTAKDDPKSQRRGKNECEPEIDGFILVGPPCLD